MEFIFKPKPKGDECFSSYIQRVAEDNIISVGQMWKYFCTNKYIYHQSAISQYIDINPYHNFNLNKFSKMLKIDVSRLESLSLLNRMSPYNLFSERYLYNLIHTKRHYCPKCLQENNYYKFIWQIKGVTFCKYHNIKLKTTCWNCNRHLPLIDRHGVIGKCSYCNAPLKDGKSPIYTPNNKERILLDLWQFLLNPQYNTSTCTVSNFTFENSLAVRLLYLLKDYDSSADKRNLNKFVNNKFSLNNFSINIELIIRILLYTNTNFEKFLVENIPENYVQTLINRHTSNIKDYIDFKNSFKI